MAVLRFLGLLVTLTASPACSLFEDYPSECADAVEAYRAGQFERAAREFAEENGDLESNEFLSLAEQGMAWHTAGELNLATRTWLEATYVLEEFDDRPTVSGRSITEEALSFIINDKTLPYDGEGFEVALLHAFLAWDFLVMGRFDDSMVEVFRGYLVEKDEERRFANQYGMNRFARFVAALAQELDGKPDEAEIDLRRLAAEVPDNPYVAWSLERVRRLQGIERAEEEALAQLVVVFEQGQMPPKYSKDLWYSTRRTFGRVSVPAFDQPLDEARVLLVSVDAGPDMPTSVVENVLANARRNLDDRVAWLTAKSAGRSAVKTIIVDESSEYASEEYGTTAGVLVGLVGGVINSLTESADLRSWLTLPITVQVLRIGVEPGYHEVSLRLEGPAGSRQTLHLGFREFRPGRPVYVTARSLGPSLFARAFGGFFEIEP